MGRKRKKQTAIAPIASAPAEPAANKTSETSQPARAAGPRARRILLLGLLLVALTVIPYLRTWTFELVYLDDYFFVEGGRWFFEDWANLPKVFTNDVWEFFGRDSSLYRPLLLLPRFFESALFGTSPGPYHILNTGLHCATVVVLFLLLVRLVDDVAAAFVSAVLFAVHPVHVPTVAWIEGYNNSMLALFVLATLLLVLVALQTGRARWAIFSGATFLLALLTKKSAIATPVLALGVAWLDMRNKGLRIERAPRRVLVATSGAFAFALATWYVLRARAIPATPEFDADFVLESAQRGWLGLVLYWGKVFFPFNLTPMPILADSVLHFGVIALVLYALVTWRSRGDDRRVLVLGAIWFVLLITPSLLVSRLETKSGAIFREDRMYQASIGAFIALAFLVRAALARHRAASVAAFVVCAVIGLGIGQARMGSYSNGLAFWTAAARGSPNLALSHQLLAIMRHRAGDVSGEKQELMRALAVNPRLEGLNNDVGAMFLREGDDALADRYFQAELALYPESAMAHYNRALVQQRAGDLTRAAESIEAYLRFTKDPDDSELRRSASAMLDEFRRAANAPEGTPREAASQRSGGST